MPKPTTKSSPAELIEDVLDKAGMTVVDGRRGRVLRSQLAVTTTIKVAEVFGKQHQHVLRAFDNLWTGDRSKIGPISGATGKDRSKIGPISDETGFRCIDRDAKTLDDFRQLNFNDSHYLDAYGRQQRMVIMTRKGFEFLTLGFTGRKALLFRMAYIERFHELDTALQRMANEAARTAYHHPSTKRVTYDYGRGAVAVLKEHNHQARPLPSGVSAIYDEDAALFETHVADVTRLLLN